MRYVLTAAFAALVTALFLTLVANPHALPAPYKKPWSQWTLKQRETYVRSNVAHARGALDWIRAHHAARELAGVVRDHRRLLRKSSANLRVIEAAIEAKQHWPWCRSGECVRTLIRRIFVEDPEGAVNVAGCESGWHADPVEGLSMTGQFVGVLQLGTEARAEAGHVGSGLYASSDPWTAIKASAWEQITAAHIFWQRYGWSRWQCSPSGGLNW